MILLALDTALEACSAAVVAGGEVRSGISEPMARGHQERLAPMVAQAMAEAALSFTALERIAVTVGPGSFTGLRVGLAFAKAMALALDIPCVGLGVLEALAASGVRTADAPLAVAALDARRGHVYLQAFAHGVPLFDACNVSIEEAQARLAALGADASTPMTGSGAALLRGEVTDAVARAPRVEIDPVVLARLGAAEPEPERMPQPLYLRAPDAKTIAERALERAGEA